MITEISVSDFFNRHIGVPIIDVRSPGEHEKGHIPGAKNIPLFTNEERAEVGTMYVQISREDALELAYKFVNPKLDWFGEESLKVAPEKVVAVHCWRGGMRSRSFAEHLDARGFSQVYLLQGGYKAYRNFMLDYFESPFRLRILGGYTGSGKTYILKELQEMGEQVVDLEGVANHKGSVFGGFGEASQPTVEQYENNLLAAFWPLDLNVPIWLEDESHRIGKVTMPLALYRKIREQRLYFIDVPKELRAKHLVGEYAVHEKEDLARAINSIHKRLGGQSTMLALEHLEKNEFFEVAMLTLQFYDKAYHKGMSKRDQEKVFSLELTGIDPASNAREILQFVQENERD
ncbi:MAG: tRNA 2-selenouridine(34) synthase MnmH [Bacteroidales bacterium]|nr:tRNA 2-selenouridine(34) synthase MnmH [Bacteroidales bacterium]